MAKFSKRHYEVVAEVMQDTKPDEAFATPGEIHEWRCVVAKFAARFASDNAAFKRDRFFRACEPGANVKARS